MRVPSVVRRVASSLLGRQALLSTIFAVFVLLSLLGQARIPIAVVRTSNLELVGIERMAIGHRLLAAVARRELSPGLPNAADFDATSILAPFGQPGSEYSLARDRVAARWRDARTEMPNLDALTDFASATTVLIGKLSDESQLTYDEDIDGINFGDLLSTQLPRAIDRAVLAAAIGQRLSKTSRFAERMAIVRYAAQAQFVWISADNDFELGREATAISQSRLIASHAAASRAFRVLLARLDALGDVASPASVATLRPASEAFVRASLAYADALEAALREIIAKRIAREYAALAFTIALAILTLGLGVLAEFSRRQAARREVRLRVETDRARAFEIELEHQRVNRARVLTEARFRSIFDHSPVGIATLDRYGALVERNVAMMALVDESFAILDRAFDLTRFTSVVAGDAPPHQTERAIDLPTGTRWIELTVFPIRISDGESIVAIATVADVTERKSLAERLRHEAAHDELTGLRARGAFVEDLGRVRGASRAPNSPWHVVMMVDLDRFKFVNDTFGHAAGDAVLVEVSRRLRSVFRAGDAIARLHGDEFAILVEVDDRAEIGGFAERVLERLRAPIAISGRSIAIDASIGIARLDADRTPEASLHDADTAMYRAKKLGRGRYVFFDDPMREATERYGRLASDLVAHLDAGAFRVAYQPIVALDEEAIEGFEALLRWRHPEFGEVGPDEFIAIAEEMGSIDALGGFVLREACRQAGYWNRRYPQLAPIRMNVNLSGRQLGDSIASEVERSLRDAGIPGESLILDITESALVESGPQISEIFARLRELGVRICLDDFGTGYSSLRYLQQFPIDEIKIDRSFVALVDRDLASKTISRMLLDLASSLGMPVVAEGIETGEQRDALRALGCHLGQGFFYSRARPPRDFEGPTSLALPRSVAGLEGVGAA